MGRERLQKQGRRKRRRTEKQLKQPRKEQHQPLPPRVRQPKQKQHQRLKASVSKQESTVHCFQEVLCFRISVPLRFTFTPSSREWIPRAVKGFACAFRRPVRRGACGI